MIRAVDQGGGQWAILVLAIAIAVALALAGCDGVRKSVSGQTNDKSKTIEYKIESSDWVTEFFRNMRPRPALIGYATVRQPAKDVRVFFGTDREPDPKLPKWMPYGSGRGSTVRYGWCDISVPLVGRNSGEIPRPFLEDSKGTQGDHFVLQNPHEESHDAFFNLLKARLVNSNADAALVFVHGFNVSFASAAFRTAQIAFDLDFQGPSIFFSWPSVGEVEDYATDYDSAHLAIPHLSKFLEDLATQSDAKKVYLIGHSMGNQALPDALIDLLKRRPELRPRFKELILAAPDVDAKIVRDNIAPFFKDLGIGVTLYASLNDRALEVARKIRHNYARVGDLHDGPVVEDGVETIDASDVDSDFLLRHSYFAESESILQDMFYLVKYDFRAPKRFGLREVPYGHGRYWKIINNRSQFLQIVLGILVLLVACYAAYFVIRRRKQTQSPR